MTYSNDELERIWYNLGNTTLAQAYGELADLERLDDEADDLRTERDKIAESNLRSIKEIEGVLEGVLDDCADLREAVRQILVDNR